MVGVGATGELDEEGAVAGGGWLLATEEAVAVGR